MPFPPAELDLRADFDLLKLAERTSDDGKTNWWAPAVAGEWFCSLHGREAGAGRFTVTEALP
jgi:hypothetical protein